MKFFNFLFLSVITVSITLTFISCGGNSDDNFLFSSSRSILPVISGPVSGTEKTSFPDNAILYEIYELLADAQNTGDENITGTGNIYKLLLNTGSIYTVAESHCSMIHDNAILSPFDLGVTGSMYNCAGRLGTMNDDYANGFAIKSTDSLKEFLLTYRYSPDAPTHLEHGILQGLYDEDTKDLNIRMLHQVLYENDHTKGTGGFAQRVHIEGNETAHEFAITAIKAGINGNSGWTTMVGKGISQGTGNYFLFKVSSSAGIADKYFCIPASASFNDLETLHAQNPSGTLSPVAPCTAYQADVDAMPMLGTGDIPQDLSDFAGSTIFLIY